MRVVMLIHSLGIAQHLPMASSFCHSMSMKKLQNGFHFQTQTRPRAAYSPGTDPLTNGSLASNKLTCSNNNGAQLIIIPPPTTVPSTLGHYLARRLVQIGVSDIFSVPGDSNLVLFDYFVAEEGLKLVGVL